MTHLIPVAAVREHQVAKKNYEMRQWEYRAMRIAQFQNRDIPQIVKAFVQATRNMSDDRLRNNVLCLNILEDLTILNESITCEQALRQALQRLDPHVTDVYFNDCKGRYGTPYDEDLMMFNIFVFFENPEPREEETAG